MRIIVLILITILLSSCAVRQVGTFHNNIVYQPNSEESANKIIFITIDGTSNTLTSRTNAGRLFEMVDTLTPLRQDRKIVTWYAEGVGSGDAKLLGLSVGAGMGQDIKNAYAFLTRVWQPGDEIYLSGFSRGAYGARALGGLLYSAGIPDLSTNTPKERNRTVDRIFDAYKTGERRGENFETHSFRRDQRIRNVQIGYHPDRQPTWGPGRDPGYRSKASKVVVEAMLIWDTVAALGAPDGKESPLEGPDHYLLTSCNVKRVYQALALDDNRVYSFTPIFADGPKMLRSCSEHLSRQNDHIATDEVWFSGAHSDVGGTYENDGLLDGSLPGVSLNWMLSKLQINHGGLLPFGLGAPEDRLGVIHDAERAGFQNKILYRQTRKPSVYSHHAYRQDNSLPSTPQRLKVHSSVFDRLRWLFALDGADGRCSGNGPRDGKPLLCAEQIASYGLVPELIKAKCLQKTDWGYELVPDHWDIPACPVVIGSQRRPEPEIARIPDCSAARKPLTGSVYEGRLSEVNLRNLKMEDFQVPVPDCGSDVLLIK
ncbi:MAG: DUF2235 domain-containing protein [Pseudomonadota bacterium]